MLTGANLVAGYRRGRTVLGGVDIEVPGGAVTGLTGPSGCGKTTLGRVLGLLHRPWSGRVKVDGVEVEGFRHGTPSRQRRAVGVVFQHPRPAVDPRFTVREIIAEVSPAAQVAALADEVGLTDELLSRRPHEVSDGQLQRACLARALAPGPDYLIADEMTAMLDASNTAALVRVVERRVREWGMGVLAISHDEDLLGHWATRVVHLNALI